MSNLDWLCILAAVLTYSVIMTIECGVFYREAEEWKRSSRMWEEIVELLNNPADVALIRQKMRAKR